MNNNVSAFSFLVLLGMMIALFVSCGVSLPPKDYFEYTSAPFEAKIDGEIDGLSFSADVISIPTDENGQGWRRCSSILPNRLTEWCLQ